MNSKKFQRRNVETTGNKKRDKKESSMEKFKRHFLEIILNFTKNEIIEKLRLFV